MTSEILRFSQVHSVKFAELSPTQDESVLHSEASFALKIGDLNGIVNWIKFQKMQV